MYNDLTATALATTALATTTRLDAASQGNFTLSISPLLAFVSCIYNTASSKQPERNGRACRFTFYTQQQRDDDTLTQTQSLTHAKSRDREERRHACLEFVCGPRKTISATLDFRKKKTTFATATHRIKWLKL